MPKTTIYVCPDCWSESEAGSICSHPEPMGDKYRLSRDLLWAIGPSEPKVSGSDATHSSKAAK